MEKIVVENLNFRYQNSDFRLKNINLKIDRGEFVFIAGQSGAGKSTLLYCLTGLIPHYIKEGEMKGDVWIDNLNTKEVSLTDLSRKIGIILQNPESQIFGMTVEEDLAFALENMGIPRYEIGRRINKVLNLLELRKFRNKAPEILSGGQKKRLIIGSILSLNPEILVLDEPFSNLDPSGIQLVASTLEKLKKVGKIIILADRKIEHVIHLVDRVIVLDKGKIIGDLPLRKFSENRNLVKRSGIIIPQVLKLSYSLQSLGMRFNKFPITVEELLRELNGSCYKN
jgi:energy-coupling factor transport system ATP-binding protein